MNKPQNFIIKDGELICYLGNDTDIVIPNGVHRIGMGAFIERKNLQSVVLPKSLTWIGQSAFSKCTSLMSIIIPEGITAIVYGSFSNCSKLETSNYRRQNFLC